MQGLRQYAGMVYVALLMEHQAIDSGLARRYRVPGGRFDAAACMKVSPGIHGWSLDETVFEPSSLCVWDSVMPGNRKSFGNDVTQAAQDCTCVYVGMGAWPAVQNKAFGSSPKTSHVHAQDFYASSKSHAFTRELRASLKQAAASAPDAGKAATAAAGAASAVAVTASSGSSSSGNGLANGAKPGQQTSVGELKFLLPQALDVWDDTLTRLRKDVVDLLFL